MAKKSFLILGHPLVVDANRTVWNEMAKLPDIEVDLVVPARWNSNLIKQLQFSPNTETDSHLRHIYSLRVCFPGKASFFFFNPFSLWSVLRKNKYDGILLTQETWSLALASLQLIRFFTFNNKTKTFLWVCQNIKKEKLKWLWPFERLITRNLSSIMGCCHETEVVHEWKGLTPSSRYLPFSFDPQLFKPHSESSSKFRLGFMGRISEEKGMQVLKTAFQELRLEIPNLELLLAGDGPLRSEFEQLEGVKYLGLLPHQKAFEFFHHIDLFILPSLTKPFWKEQFGRVLIESAASKVLVAGSSSGAIPEVLEQLQSPYCFQEGDVKALKEIILKAIHLSSTERQHILEKSYQRASEHFSHQSVAKLALKIMTVN